MYDFHSKEDGKAKDGYSIDSKILQKPDSYAQKTGVFI